MIKNTFSPNQLETWINCPQKYNLKYIKNVNIPEKADFFKIGKKIHTMVYYFLKGYDIEQFEAVLTAEEKTHWLNIKKLPLLKLPLIACEWEFNVPINNFWLNGVIDAIFYDKTQNKYIIADWKTGKNSYDKEDFQQMFYMLALYRAQKELDLTITPSDIIFRYIKTIEGNQPNAIEFSETKKQSYESRISGTIKEIYEAKEYEQKHNNESCKFCPYKGFC